MKQVLKVIFISILCTIGGMALILGGAYIFGAFNEKSVYAENLSFSQTEVISAEAFSLKITTATENVTKKTLKLVASPGGEDVVNFPKTVEIGEDFFISPVTNEANQNVGGVVELTCMYDDINASQSVIATCKILIDVDVESCSVILNTKKYEIGDIFTLASKNSDLNSLLTVSPTYALNPYKSRLNLNSISQDSVLNASSFVDKKIFLSLSQGANFVVDGVDKTSTIELPYSYDTTSSKFCITSDIQVKIQSEGEMVLGCYVCPTYKLQKDVTLDNIFEEKSQSIVCTTNEHFVATNYTVSRMSVNTSATPLDINYGEEVTIYLNNPKAEKGSLNLGVELFSDKEANKIDDYFLKYNVFVKIAGDVKGSLTRVDGTSNDAGLCVYCDTMGKDKSTWCFKYKYTDFMAYYNYKNSSSDSNRIALEVWYENEEEKDENNKINKLSSYTFYFNPKANEMTSISANYGEKEQFVYKSGNSLSLTKNDFNIEYSNGQNSSFDTIGLFLKAENTTFYPTKSGTFTTKFSFIPTTAGEFTNFSQVSNWCNLAKSIVTLTQGENVYTLTFNDSGTGYAKNLETITFEADKQINVVVTSLSCALSLSGLNKELFNVKIANVDNKIKLRQTKFYEIVDKEQSKTPLLYVDRVTIAGEYTFVDFDDTTYLMLDTASSISLSGIGDIVLLAKNIYIDENGTVYALDAQDSNVEVYVYEDISSLQIYSYTEDNVNGKFSSSTTYDEKMGSGYLLITSSQLETLRRIIEIDEERLKISVKQRTDNVSTLTEAQKQAIVSANKNAITFGDLEQVEKDGVFIGYKVQYTIGEVKTLNINGTQIDNIFDITIQVDGSNGDAFDGSFVFENDVDDDTIWSITLVDKIYKYVGVTHEYSTSGTLDKPISLEACTTGQELSWYVNNNGNRSVTGIDVKYGLKLLETDTELNLANACTYKISLVTNGNRKSIQSPESYCTIKDGKVTFKNVPYDKDGVYYSVQFYVPSTEHDNTYIYVWNVTKKEFEKQLSEELNQFNGVTLYFKVVGVDIQITANSTVTIDGSTDSTRNLFGEGGLFTITGNGNVPLNQILTCSINKTQYIEVSNDYSKITIKNNLLISQDCTFYFYAGEGTSSNPIKIINGTETLDYCNKTIETALDPIVYTKEFSAPCTEAFISGIKYKNGENALREITAKLAVVEDTDNVVSKIEGFNITFNTMTGTKNVKLRLTLSYKDDSTYSDEIVYDDVTVTSRYTDSDLVLGSGKEEFNGVEYETITAGTMYKEGSGITLANALLTDRSTIKEISIESITNVNSSDKLSATTHFVQSTSKALSDFSFKSTDLNYDKLVNIVFKIIFSNYNGALLIEKQVLLKSNLNITFIKDTFSSWDSINLGDYNNYFVNSAIPSSNFLNDYTRASFEYNNADDAQYFTDVTSKDSVCCLKVVSANSTSEEKNNVPVTIIFHYKATNGSVTYTLDFEFTFTLNIQYKGNQ